MSKSEMHVVGHDEVITVRDNVAVIGSGLKEGNGA